MRNRFLATTLFAGLLASSAPVLAQKSAGEMLDDSTINATVKAELIGNRSTHAREINVETYKGTVQLSGFVSSQAEKDEASRVASGISGVKDVRNNLAVAESTSMSQKLDDSVTTGRVKAALIDTKGVSSAKIDVETHDGVVQLSGFVGSEAMKTKAGQAAARVDGVKSVSNVLVVRPD